MNGSPPNDAPTSSPDAAPGAEPANGPPQEPNASPVPAPDTAADTEGSVPSDPAAPADAGGEADPEPEAAPAADVAEPEQEQEQEQEQEELWRDKRARAWHERTWLRVVAVLAVVTGIAAIIPYPLRITSECTMIPQDQVKVRSELPGVVSEILVDEGQSVKKGDVIARIDDRALKAERQKVALEIETLQANPRPENAEAREAAVKRARAELAYIDEKLAMTVVRAPVDGEILTPRFHEHLHEGVEAGGLICEIANTRRMRAEILIPEREVDAVALGMPAVVKVESYPTRPFTGKVDFIAPTVDSETRRVRVAVGLDNPAGLLKANMTGFGEIEADKHSLLTLATRRALRWIRVRFLL
ncbi:MAG TPA: efflux RND transporter periplasmic adaptor subunit [Kofleriaceae bacterium]|jgi:multidrug efflux pump subunit AcrA (membrane-fusion protein)|nr:efflux RND transporter periplasmic adaptor subunit [Kofleriaceae bacterium]